MPYYTPINEDDSDGSTDLQPLGPRLITDGDEFVSSIIITDQEEEPSTLHKILSLIKTIILFPTKVTVICGSLCALWLSFNVSMVSIGGLFMDKCPGSPRLPVLMVAHGTAWIVLCIYTLMRLVWVEIRTDRTPHFKVHNCINPEKGTWYWRKEFTYCLDGLLMLVLLTTFIAQMIEVTLVRNGSTPVVFTNEVEAIALCKSCCLPHVMHFAMGQVATSNLVHTWIIFTYLYLFGILNKVRDMLCKRDPGRTKEESITLM